MIDVNVIRAIWLEESANLTCYCPEFKIKKRIEELEERSHMSWRMYSNAVDEELRNIYYTIHVNIGRLLTIWKEELSDLDNVYCPVEILKARLYREKP